MRDPEEANSWRQKCDYQGPEERRSGELFNGCRVFVQDEENVPGMDNGDGCTTFSVTLMPLDSILTRHTMVSSMLYLFYHNF